MVAALRATLPRAVLTCCVLLALAAATACQTADDWPKGDHVQIGVKSDQPGTGYMAKYPPHTGFDIKIAEVAAKALGKEPSYQVVPSEERQTSLDGEHGLDLVVATYSINNDRLTGANGMPAHDFVGPYATTYAGFLVRKKGKRIRALKDLRGTQVCTWTGTTSMDTLKDRIPGLVPVGKRNASDCVESLLKGRVAAVFTDQLLLYGFTGPYPELEVVPDLTIGSAEHYGIGLPKGHRGACEKIKEALKDYVSSGGWTRDFTDELQPIREADPHWESHYKPTSTQIDTYSCRDKLGS